jgi:hypothetical protein
MFVQNLPKGILEIDVDSIYKKQLQGINSRICYFVNFFGIHCALQRK